MSEDPASSVAVTLSIVPSLEERMIDWLLDRDDVAGFTACTVQAHSTDARILSVAEQVSGRQRRLELRLELATTALDGWLDTLQRTFGGADVHYFVTPILRAGRLRP